MRLRDGEPGSRREFFRESLGQWLEKAMEEAEERVSPDRWLRPPGALPEVAFLAACTRCGDCVTACPPRAIRTVPTGGGLAAGTPYLEVQRSPCVACADMPCATVCPTDALTVPPGGWARFRLGRVEFLPERCVTYRGTPCRACADACPIGERALAMDQGGHPVLRHEGCVGCGVCIRACISVPPSFRFHPKDLA